MWRFITENRRWLATGLLLAFGSCLGQTWFISLFAGEIRADYGLSDGQWGLLYTAATLASAALLFGRGSLADTVPLSRLAPMVAVIFAGAAALMALGWSVWTLGIAVFLLRFCGQGMFSHIQMTAMARWFVATRGRAIAIANLGYTSGQVLLPLPAVLLMGWIGWQASWGWSRAFCSLSSCPCSCGFWRRTARQKAAPGRQTARRALAVGIGAGGRQRDTGSSGRWCR